MASRFKNPCLDPFLEIFLQANENRPFSLRFDPQNVRKSTLTPTTTSKRVYSSLGSIIRIDHAKEMISFGCNKGILVLVAKAYMLLKSKRLVSMSLFYVMCYYLLLQFRGIIQGYSHRDFVGYPIYPLKGCKYIYNHSTVSLLITNPLE